MTLKKSFYLIAQLHGLFWFGELTREVLQVKRVIIGEHHCLVINICHL